ncbi:MFS transporter [Brucella haematophila]|uniref:MFS transporter n=1 Tax=Brucella haematophila TaxID=419474 RepID=UPI00110D3098|nr:MFS transporter [Brucella haematophila]TMU95482.1 MFS transporter [Brucella haematophila]
MLQQHLSSSGVKTRARYFILFMCFAGMTINYLDRANMSVALPFIDAELGLELTNTQKGLILGAFFWAYDGMMLFAGWITDKLGARKTFSLAAIWWSVFTMLTPLANSFWSFFAVRFALGAGEAPAYPSAIKATSQWFPRSERAFSVAVIDSGSRVGTVLALPIVTAIIAFATWHYSFLILGAIGVVWAFAWYKTYRSPGEHPWANEEERRYIAENGGRTAENDDETAARLSWKSLFRYRTIWGMMLGFFCLNFVIYFFLTWFPSFLKDARGLDLKSLGLYGMIPGLLAVVSAWSIGAYADHHIRKGADVTKVRKTIMVGGMIGGAAILPAASVESLYAALFFLAISYSSLAVAGTAIWALPADIAPSSRHVASIGGIQNFAANIAGIISPLVFGFLLDKFGGSYAPVFLLASCMALTGAFSYAFIVGKAEPLPVMD